MNPSHLPKVKKFLTEYIKQKENYLKSENIETGKPPVFILYCARGNDRESLNMYFDYKTSKQFINRAILSLGYWTDFSREQISELESHAQLILKNLGIKSQLGQSSYQSEGA
jgi:hypothetical protein